MQEKVFIPNKKGLKLAAVVHRPEGDGKYPGVIFLAGFSMDKEDLHAKSLCEDLAQAGFAAIRFETAGMGESEGDISEYLLTNYYNDIDVIYEYFSKLDFVDNERIGLVGHSLGSVVAIYYAAKNPTAIKALCAIMPFSHFSDLHLQISMDEWKEKGFLSLTKATGEEVKIPYTFVEDADKANVLDIIFSLSQPKLIVMSTGDDVGDPVVTQDIYEHASEPKEMLVLDNIEHTYRKHPEAVRQVNEKVIEFLEAFL